MKLRRTAHDEDDPHQQEQDLRRVVEEEVERLCPAGIGGQLQNRVADPVPERQQPVVDREPDDRGDAEYDDGTGASRTPELDLEGRHPITVG